MVLSRYLLFWYSEPWATSTQPHMAKDRLRLLGKQPSAYSKDPRWKASLSEVLSGSRGITCIGPGSLIWPLLRLPSFQAPFPSTQDSLALWAIVILVGSLLCNCGILIDCVRGSPFRRLFPNRRGMKSFAEMVTTPIGQAWTQMQRTALNVPLLYLHLQTRANFVSLKEKSQPCIPEVALSLICWGSKHRAHR